jgi:acyl-CoA reductase-like NAD-dependent aldehyde dehydrogenase
MNIIKESVEQGAKVMAGGKAHDFVIEPPVIRYVKNDYSITQYKVLEP